MGGKTSKKKDDLNIEHLKAPNTIDHIATKFIVKSDFQEKLKLHKPEYCKKLVILTSKVIDHFFNDIEIKYMAQRTKKGTNGRVLINKLDQQKIIHLDKTNLDILDISNRVKKKRMCIGISKFYIKIAHLFSAISITINPRYTYIDADGEEQTISLSKKANIPTNLNIKMNTELGLCSKRINALRPQQNNENGIVVRSRNCNMNKKMKKIMKDNEIPIETVTSKSLYDEPGMPELELLYYDKFDFNTGKYTGMSPESKKEYQKDILKLYQLFTGKKNIPKNDKGEPVITKMSDIPLMNFHHQKLCKNKDSPWNRSYRGSSTDKLFKKYVDHLKKMIETSQTLEKSLLNIINQLFSYWLDHEKNKKTLTINPNLNENTLQKLIEETRGIIIKLYIGCEEDFQKGLNLFEAIVKTKMLSTNQRRNKNLEKKTVEINSTITEKKAPQYQSTPNTPQYSVQ